MHRLRICVLILGILALAGFTACSEDNPADDGDDTGTIGGIATKHTDPAELLDAYARAISAKNLEAYKALLVQPGDNAPPFEFCPRPEDPPDFPWLEGDCRDYETEIAIMANMFDTDFSPEWGRPVLSIQMGIDIMSSTDQGEGKFRVDCTATFLVLVGPDDGFFSDTRFLFDLFPVGGYLRIQRIEEIWR